MQLVYGRPWSSLTGMHTSSVKSERGSCSSDLSSSAQSTDALVGDMELSLPVRLRVLLVDDVILCPRVRPLTSWIWTFGVDIDVAVAVCSSFLKA